MGEMINKPDANPIVAAIATAFWGIGYFLIGQKKKGMIVLGFNVVTAFCCLYLFGLPWLVNLVCAYDAYLVAQKLASGQSVGENENGLEFLNSIFKD
jgi:TM2 domain-containing membrane protein YozV